jgi:DNA-binding beta-propeller fold protein YncE
LKHAHTSLAIVLAAAAVGCTGTETGEQIKREYDPYKGDAYPDRRPTFQLPNGDVGLTSDNGSDSVSVLDLVNKKTLGAAPIGRDPVDNDGPHHIAGDRVRGFAYTALAYPPPSVLPGPHASHGSSARSGFVQKLALDDLRVLGEVRVDTNPGDVVLSDDGARLVVSHFDLQKAINADGGIEDKRATIALLDPTQILAEGSAEPVRIPTCIAPHGVALSRPDAKTAYVACYGEDVIAIVNLDDPKAEVVRVPIGAGGGQGGAPTYGPYSAVLSPTGKKLAVGNTESRDLRIFDVASQTFDPKPIKDMSRPMSAPFFTAWSADESKLFIPMQRPCSLAPCTQTADALIVVDVATGAIVLSRDFDKASCILPHEAVFSSDGSALYVVCEGDHVSPSVVLALDPATLDTKATMNVGVYPDRVALLRAP